MEEDPDLGEDVGWTVIGALTDLCEGAAEKSGAGSVLSMRSGEGPCLYAAVGRMMSVRKFPPARYAPFDASLGPGIASEGLEAVNAGDGGILDRLAVEGVVEKVGVEVTLGASRVVSGDDAVSSKSPAIASTCSE